MHCHVLRPCIGMFTRMCTGLHTHTPLRVCACVRECMRACVRACVRPVTHARVCVRAMHDRMCACKTAMQLTTLKYIPHARIHACPCAHACTCTHTHAHAHTRTHTNAHAHARARARMHAHALDMQGPKATRGYCLLARHRASSYTVPNLTCIYTVRPPARV